MADKRTMAQLLQAPTEGYEDAIVIPEINANFELKHGLINLVQNKQFFGHDKEDPHAHIRYFNKITSTMRFPDIPSTSIKLMLFPFSLEELHQLNTFYNALNANDQDSLNSAAGENFLDKMPRECLRIIESKSKVRNSRNKTVIAKVSSNSSTPGISPDVAALTTEVSIQMAEIDEEKTAFHTPHGVYCYTKMPLGLKNAGATYQRLVDKAFEKQVGWNLEVYVNDLVIKSPEGIKPCPEKIKAVLQLPSPRTIKEVQSLNGKLAGLNRFLSKSAEKSLPLFKTLKKCVKKSDFHWTPEAEQAFKQLKHHISELPMLVAPRPKEELMMYLSASQGAVGAVFVRKYYKVLLADNKVLLVILKYCSLC
ncbi:reverse transcriptase domain-containing protein [Tanacetum coccineum]